MFKYATDLDKLILPEYGRNVQKMIQIIKKIEDRKKRNDTAAYVVDLMKKIIPHKKNYNELEKKVWIDFFIIAEWEIDIDTPFEIPKPEEINAPLSFQYPIKDRTFYKYGKNMHSFIKKTKDINDNDLMQMVVDQIANYIKIVNQNWRKELKYDDFIVKELRDMYGEEGDKNIDFSKITFWKNTSSSASKKSKSSKNSKKKSKYKGQRKN